MYTILGTRLDLAFSMLIASRYCSNLLKKHYEQIKRILRYVLGILETRLEYSRDYADIVSQSDAEFVGDRLDSKLIRGYIFTIRGTAVSQRYKKQTIVATLTTEAEYTVLYYAAKEAVQLKYILEYFRHPQETIRIKVDNKSCIRIANNPEIYKKTKYIQVQFYFTRDLVKDRTITLVYTLGHVNISDIFIKALDRTTFERHARGIGIFGINEGRILKVSKEKEQNNQELIQELTVCL